MRLEQAYRDNIGENLADFNSIKVRLELSLTSFPSLTTLFQFHKGAIRTSGRTAVDLFQYDFNSIKVRLEQIRLLNPRHQFAHFNSIKVRLELIKVLIYALTLIFQFHKGAIRTSVTQ